MLRARLLVIKAHLNLSHPDRERILDTSFLIGLYDWQLAATLALPRIQSAADAERLALEEEAVHHDQQSRRFNLNLLPEGALVDNLNESPSADLEFF